MVRMDAAEVGNTAGLRELMPALTCGGMRAASPNGVLGDPRGATADEGEKLLAGLVDDLRDASRRGRPTTAAGCDEFAGRVRSTGMGIVKSNLAISLDGFSSAPGQSREAPFGVGGDRLTEWMFETDQPGREADADPQRPQRRRRRLRHGAAHVRRLRRGWDLGWRGWWGADPPYHTPVFVLTHHERAPLPMQGGTTFHFVTDGIESALKQAQAAAGDKPVCIAGGATTVRQYLAAGLVDELCCTSCPSCSARASGCGTGWAAWPGAGRGDRLPDGHPCPLPLHPPKVSPVFATVSPGSVTR